MIQTRPAARALMACLGEHSRFRLVQALLEGPRCVTDLAVEVGLSQSCTTRHLQALERRHVVRGTRDGKRVLYRIRDDHPDLRPLLAWALRERAAGLGPARPEPRPLARRANPQPNSAAGTANPTGAAPKPAGALTKPEVVMAKPTAPDVPEPRIRPTLELEPTRTGARRAASDLEDFLL